MNTLARASIRTSRLFHRQSSLSDIFLPSASPHRAILRSTSTKSPAPKKDPQSLPTLAEKANALSKTPGTVQLLGFGGAIPFLAGAVASTFSGDAMPFARATQLYGASILSFLGGVHWGVGLRSAVHGVPATRDYIYGVIPSLFAWVAALMPPPDGLFVLSGSFGLAFLYDMFRFGRKSAVPAWYRRLRIPLSIAAAGGCFVSYMAAKRELEASVCPRDSAAILSTSPAEVDGTRMRVAAESSNGKEEEERVMDEST